MSNVRGHSREFDTCTRLDPSIPSLMISAFTTASVVVLGVSAALTLGAWYVVARSPDPPLFKLMLAAVAAIPFLGPVMWFFIASMPAKRLGSTPIFRGPIDPNPTHPQWLAWSHLALAVLAACIVIYVHALLFVAFL